MVAGSQHDAIIVSRSRSVELIALDEALDRLSKLDPRQGKVVELRFFGGRGNE
jgi:RNA polymerase sigma-70 factor (ECF subfamily)